MSGLFLLIPVYRQKKLKAQVALTLPIRQVCENADHVKRQTVNNDFLHAWKVPRSHRCIPLQHLTTITLVVPLFTALDKWTIYTFVRTLRTRHVSPAELLARLHSSTHMRVATWKYSIIIGRYPFTIWSIATKCVESRHSPDIQISWQWSARKSTTTTALDPALPDDSGPMRNGKTAQRKKTENPRKHRKT